MDQASVSSWKLLPWLILGGSNKKTHVDRSSKKVSAYKRRLQAHAAIARSLSPFCARTSFNSPAMPEEENKCLLSLSAFMSVCGHCALRDVQVALAPIHSPHQQKAYIKAIHHHLQEPSLQCYTKPPSSRRAHQKAAFGGSFHTEQAHTSKEGDSVHQRDHHQRHMTPPKRGDFKRIEACDNEIAMKLSKQDKPHQLKQYIEGEVIASGESRPRKYGKLRHKLEVYSFDTGDSNSIQHSHHGRPTTSSSSSKKGTYRPKLPFVDGCASYPIKHASHGTKASSASLKKTISQSETHHRKGSSVTKNATQTSPNLEADVYVCTTTHVLEQHKGKMKAFEERGMHDYGCKHPSWKEMHRYKHGDPILKSTHSGTEPSPKSKHSFVAKGSETFWEASDDPQFLKQSKSHKSDALKERANHHTSKDLSLSHLLLKDYHESKEWCTGKDPLSVKCSESFTNKDSSMSFKSGDTFANTEPLASKGREFCVNKDLLSLKSSESYVQKNLSSKLTSSPVYKDNQGDNNAAKASEKIKLIRLGHHDKVSGGIWMQDTLPVVKYSHNPYKDFHSSMLEMLLERGFKDLHELQDMFVCYVLLNSPCNQKYIERAFRDLLTDLYRCKLMKSLQVEEMQLAKTEGLCSHQIKESNIAKGKECAYRGT